MIVVQLLFHDEAFLKCCIAWQMRKCCLPAFSIMFSIKTKKEIDYLNSFSAFFFLQIKYFCKPFTALKKSFENILGKGENGGNEKHHPVIETLKNEAFY